MRKIDVHERRSSDAAPGTGDAMLEYSQDDARQRLVDRRMLYVLGFGIAGAVVANALVLTYFLS